MKKRLSCYVRIFFMGVMMILILNACSGGSKKNIIGQWEDDYDIIQFNADGTFASPYYWLGGNYNVDGDTLTLSTILGKEVYSIEISNDNLLLYDGNGNLSYKFAKTSGKSVSAKADNIIPNTVADNSGNNDVHENGNAPAPEPQENNEADVFPKISIPLAVENNLITSAYVINKNGVAAPLYASDKSISVSDTRSIDLRSDGALTFDETHFFIKNDNSLWGYGYNRFGQLGDNTGVDKDSSNLAHITDDVANLYIIWQDLVLIVKNDKTLWGWGTGMVNILPELSEDKFYAPAKILDDVVDVFNTDYACFFLQSDGTLWTWAEMSDVNDFDSGKGPGLRPIMKSVTEFYRISDFYYALRSDNSLWYWEYFASAFNGTSEPEFKMLIENVEKVFLHPQFCMALTQDKVLYEWKNGYGGFEPLERLSDVKEAYPKGSVYNYDECFRFAIKNDNTLWGWGFNNNGELGDGSKITRSEPVKIADNVKNLVVDWALLSMDGEVLCWTGDNVNPTLIYTGVKETYGTDNSKKCLLYDSGHVSVGYFFRDGFEKLSSGEEKLSYSLDDVKRVVENRGVLCFETYDGLWYCEQEGSALFGGVEGIPIEGGINFPE